ncbi:hypothetical protein [Halorubrum vacuolatum]|uniref:hypothetical protein n=1 Tax=Halorubrum vacuolatum TaxID=63740 RepID=UPI001C530ADB|nr:hypothetical protein [Halorubrum vacuolatum]
MESSKEVTGLDGDNVDRFSRWGTIRCLVETGVGGVSIVLDVATSLGKLWVDYRRVRSGIAD